MLRIPGRIVISFLCLTLSSAAQVGQPTGNIVGQVRVMPGMLPTQRVMVQLVFRGATIYSNFTDNEGRFGFHELVPNQYRVVIEDTDYYPYDEVVVVDPRVSTINIVHPVLTRKSKTSGDSQPETAGGNPYLVSPADFNRQFSKKVVKEFETGVRADQEGKTEDAERHYKKALELAPEYYPAHNNLGSLYLRRHDFVQAQREFQRALELNKNDAAAYFNLGNTYLLTQRYEESEHYVSEGLRREPNSAFGHLLEGTLCSRTGKYAEAEKELKGAVQMDGHLAAPHLELVNLYLRQKRQPEAIEQLETFLKLFPADPSVPQAQAVLRRLSNQPQHFQ